MITTKNNLSFKKMRTEKLNNIEIMLLSNTEESTFWIEVIRWNDNFYSTSRVPNATSLEEILDYFSDRDRKFIDKVKIAPVYINKEMSEQKFNEIKKGFEIYTLN